MMDLGIYITTVVGVVTIALGAFYFVMTIMGSRINDLITRFEDITTRLDRIETKQDAFSERLISHEVGHP